MTVRITCGDRPKRVASQRIRTLILPSDEHDALALVLAAASWAESKREQAASAAALAPDLAGAAPTLAAAFHDLRVGHIDALYVRGLPEGHSSGRVLLLGTTSMLGSSFNYSGQNGGELVMQLRPSPDAAPNTNATIGEFGFHTDDAVIARACRAEWISLFGVINPPGTLTGYASTRDALAVLATQQDGERLAEVLFAPRFRVCAPPSIDVGALWSEPTPIVSFSPDGIDTRYPSYRIAPVDAADDVARAAIVAFHASLERVAVDLPIDAGTLLAFSNTAGVHRRGPIVTGDRLVLRTYATRDLRALQAATGEVGPIFPACPLVAHLRS